MANIGAVCSGSTLFASMLNSSEFLDKYLKQTTSTDDIFRCIFFLGALRVKPQCNNSSSVCKMNLFTKLRFVTQVWVGGGIS